MKKHVYTIAPDAPFLDRLAEGLWEMAGEDAFRLADMLVLLPTRRACRLLREAFPRVTGTRAILLPRMRPVGDLDEDEFYFALDDALDITIAPAISPLRRQLLLAQLIAKKDSKMPLDQAAHLAEALASFLDEVQIERRDFADLAKLAPEQYARHWQETLEFLEILTKSWPQMLAEEGAIDPARHRNLVIEAQAKAWRAKPPAYPVIAAGSTGSQPATADLLDAIAAMPNGAVILPGLDTELEEAAWQEVNETHPQFGMKHLLEKFGVAFKDVKPWIKTRKAQPRVRLLQESMRPAEVTDAWRNLDAKKIPRSALKGLSRFAFDNLQEEAQAIALLMRGTLEKPRRTAALVTADRDLAERVANELKRWNIEANDSAGTSLAAHPAGNFLLDVLGAARPEATGIEYLALLKHPLAACGLDPVLCRARAREAEILVWRSDTDPRKSAGIRGWLGKLKEMFRPLTQNWHKKKPFAEWIESHCALALQLASSHDQTGSVRFWRGPSGEEMALWLDEMRMAAHDFPPCDGGEYASLFAGLLRAKKIRPRYGQHPRISILGPLEARLIQANVTILGGLNEGSWPPEAAVDPWMSRPMKDEFGLPLPERRIGLSAHDFVQLASAPEVILTRARRSGNAPTVPSRFLLQLETVLRALGYADEDHDVLESREPWAAWARSLDEPKSVTPCGKPEPRPPVSVRPHKLHVTEIGTWWRNPYAIYARHILGLKKLDPLEIEATAADKGIIIHRALEIFLRRHLGRLPPDGVKELCAIGREVFAPHRDQPQVMAFWWPRFERIAAWFVAFEHERRAQGIKPLGPEARGEIRLTGGFTLKGRADRIDRLADGTLAIIDYKTGGTPKQAEIKAGIEPQLPLLALIAAEGGFKDIPAAQASQLAYWKLSGGSEAGEEIFVKEAVDTLVTAARAGLENLITLYADELMPYRAVPKPGLQPRYDDYAHLARLAEWGRFAEDA